MFKYFLIFLSSGFKTLVFLCSLTAAAYFLLVGLTNGIIFDFIQLSWNIIRISGIVALSLIGLALSYGVFHIWRLRRKDYRDEMAAHFAETVGQGESSMQDSGTSRNYTKEYDRNKRKFQESIDEMLDDFRDESSNVDSSRS